MLDTFDEIIYETFKEHDTVIDMYQKALDIRPCDYDLILKCINFMCKYKKWRNADFAYGRACDLAKRTEKTNPERIRQINYEYGKFLLIVRNQFARSNKHLLIAAKFNGISEIYENMINDRIENIEIENERIIQKHKESKAKGKPVTVDASQDKMVHVFKKAYVQFLDKVLHDFDKAKEYVGLVLKIQHDHIPTLFVNARIEIEKNKNFKSALENIQMAVSFGYVENNSTSKILQTDNIITKLKDNEDLKDEYIDLLKLARTPINERESNDGKTKKQNGKKKKK